MRSSSTAKRYAHHRQADRAGEELRRPSRHRHREHAIAQRATPAHGRSLKSLDRQTAMSEVLERYQQFADRFNTGIRYHPRQRHAPVRRQSRGALAIRRRIPCGHGAVQCLRRIRRALHGHEAQAGRSGPARLAALECRTVHVADITAEPGFSPMVLQYERARTVLAVPLLREKDLVGVIAIWRREVRPFTEQQIALVPRPTRIRPSSP